MNVRIEYYGMEGEGRTLTEAKRDAGAKIERAMTGSYTPKFIQAHSKAVLIHREPDGWYYSPINNLDATERLCTVGTYDTQKEAERGARQHLAQLIFTLDGPDGSEVIQNKANLAEHKSWTEYQHLYRAWRDMGIDENLAHEKACRHLKPEGGKHE